MTLMIKSNTIIQNVFTMTVIIILNKLKQINYLNNKKHFKKKLFKKNWNNQLTNSQNLMKNKHRNENNKNCQHILLLHKLRLKDKYLNYKISNNC